MPESDFLRKMRWKGEGKLLIVNAPDIALPLLDFPHVNSNSLEPADFILLFVRNSTEAAEFMPAMQAIDFTTTAFWIAYPKKSSSIASDLSRDILWNQLRGIGLTGVSLISMNPDWSAARYKPETDVRHSDKGSHNVTEAMAKLLQSDDSAREFFYGLSATNRKEYIRWITDAKRSETRERRLSQLLNRLNLGLRNPSEKPS